jgi:hypothetical protein
MPNLSRRFDSYIPQVNADKLKKMVRTYGGDSKMRKQECVDFLLAALSEPEMVRKAIENLEPFEQLSLALVKQMGGAADYQAVGIGVLASGLNIAIRMRRFDFFNQLATHLVERGILLNAGYSGGSFYAGHSRVQLFSDPRLLAHVGPPQIEPAGLPAAPTPAVTHVRMPPTVVLELIGFLQTLESMGGLGLTQKGELRINDVRKFQKALPWSTEDWEIDGLLFKDATNALIHALRHSDFLEFAADVLVLKSPVETVAERDYADQVSMLVNGFLRVSEWTESRTKRWSYSSNNYPQGRAALLMVLTSLPLDTDDFYTIDALDRLLFDRIGEHFSLEGSVYRYLSTYQKTPAEVRQMEAEWLAEKREKWLKQERQWIEDALSSWLYFLGMVELGTEGKRPVAFRLTELGKAILHPAKAISVTTAAPTSGEHAAGAWVVQPNFDVMVYLDRTTPPQLAFLERHAERTQSQQYMAHYRLTRESVYQGLESGTTLDVFLEELRRHAQTPLPQNVTVEIREWAALREQVILHHRADLLEFADTAARDAMLATNIDGSAVGDRYLLLGSTVTQRKRLPKSVGRIERLNYAQPLPKVLRADETGGLQLKGAVIDLLIEAQLDQWSDRTKDGQWQLTPATVRAFIKAGGRINELIDLLTARLAHHLPPLLELALRNWSGRRTKSVELERFVVLRCYDDDGLHAILTSKRLKPYLRGTHEDNLVLFTPDDIEEVQEILRWAGIELTELHL